MSLEWSSCAVCKRQVLESAFSGTDRKGRCSTCADLDDPRRFSSEDVLRCPECGSTQDVSDFEGALHEEGSHEVECHDCDAKFHVQAEVSWSFTSPAMGETEVGW